MTMTRRDLTRLDELETGIEALCDLRRAANARILQHEHPPLGFLYGQQVARFHQQRTNLVVLPERRYDCRIRRREHEPVEHLPERCRMDAIQTVIERLSLGRRLRLDDKRSGLVH